MTSNLSETLEQIGQQAQAASQFLSQATTDTKNEALLAIAGRITKQTEVILAANRADLKAGSERGLTSAMLDRTRLDPKRIQSIADSVRELVNLEDPCSDRCYWDHLRISAQCHERRSFALPQGWKCRDFARRLGVDSIEHGLGGGNKSWMSGRRLARTLGPACARHGQVSSHTDGAA